MRSLIAGNWKMHGTLAWAEDQARRLAEKARNGLPCDVLVCPPATLLNSVAGLLRDTGILVGAQDCHHETHGAYTGDIAATMLADLGCSHVLVGHSERRTSHGEGSRDVRKKAKAAHQAGLVAIICIGENRDERRAGKAFDTAADQLARSFPVSATAANTVIAWEPVWAIGTGDTANAADVLAMHRFLKQQLMARLGEGVRLLYGGSVNPSNSRELLAIEPVDGLLIGGASLDPDRFWQIATDGAPD
ncbi:MAG: triose-phosphate isomerase [Alphaproteobacteria bacterium]|nr:triose-phosphate isomerase [Alphaproteobacteria bacterium]MCY4609700.1 triose-phosphate isomerase [bacterium]